MSAKTRKKPAVDADLKSAERVLRLEADGIRNLARALDGNFKAAVDLLASTSGRVVVTGMGKSGHIAHKIAATLASVGTPAVFVHPAEASHGDLGMVTRADSIIALSNSGETVELTDLLTYSRRFSIPLVGITSKARSALSEHADVTLVLPPSPEACPMGLAPTTSTTMMLALGDAIAVALLERKGFSSSDFQVLHPGGKLGQTLLRVSDLMRTGDEIPLLPPGAPMSDAILIMTAKTFGCVGIVNTAGRLIGIITDGDLRRHLGPDLLKMTAGEVMTRRPKTIRPQALASEAIGMMNARSITNLFVVKDGAPVGIVRMHDCLRAGVA